MKQDQRQDAVGLDLERAPRHGAQVRALLLFRVPDAWPEPFLCHLSISSGAEPREAFR